MLARTHPDEALLARLHHLLHPELLPHAPDLPSRGEWVGGQSDQSVSQSRWVSVSVLCLQCTLSIVVGRRAHTSTFPLSRATASSPPDALAAMASTARGSQSMNLQQKEKDTRVHGCV